MCHELKPDGNVLWLLEPAAVYGSDGVSSSSCLTYSLLVQAEEANEGQGLSKPAVIWKVLASVRV